MCASLSAVDGKTPKERVALWPETFESWLGSSKLSFFFFKKWYVVKDKHRPEERTCVRVTAVEARKAQERAPCDTSERQTPSWNRRSGRRKRSLNFCLASVVIGTGPESCGRLPLSAVEGGKPQERVALRRETIESWLESSKLSPFFLMVRREGQTPTRGTDVCAGHCCRGKEDRGEGAVCYG